MDSGIELRLDDIDLRLSRIELTLNLINKRSKTIMSDMQDLDATLTELEGDVANVEAGEASAVALINGLSDKIDQLIASAPDTSTAIARVQTFMSRVRASNQSLADAVMANPVPA